MLAHFYILIALGGRVVVGELLGAALWPDAQPQAADNALAITLKRLRTLLGDHLAAIQKGGRLTLDSGRCWVDAWALQGLLERAKALRLSRARPSRIPDREAVAASSSRREIRRRLRHNQPSTPVRSRLRPYNL